MGTPLPEDTERLMMKIAGIRGRTRNFLQRVARMSPEEKSRTDMALFIAVASAFAELCDLILINGLDSVRTEEGQACLRRFPPLYMKLNNACPWWRQSFDVEKEIHTLAGILE